MSSAFFDPLQRGRGRGTLPGGGGGPPIGTIPRPSFFGRGGTARPDLSRRLLDPKTGMLKSVDLKQVPVKVAIAGAGVGVAVVAGSDTDLGENVREGIGRVAGSVGDAVGTAVTGAAEGVGSVALPLAIVAGVALFAYAKGRK